MHNNPIGIFDSGVGGFSVLREIRRVLPDESIVYFADSANCPYGSKNENEASTLAHSRIKFLIDKGCKLIVVACNTVTAVAIDQFRNLYDIPFIGMEPALKPAAAKTKTKTVGVLATENTLNGRLFKQTREKYANGIEVIIQPGYGLVELVESGEQESPKARDLLNEYLLPMLEKGADTIVLGCTHYPFLMNQIKQITKEKCTVIDPSAAVAAQTQRVLKTNGLQARQGREPVFELYTTGETMVAEKILTRTLNTDSKITCLKV